MGVKGQSSNFINAFSISCGIHKREIKKGTVEIEAADPEILTFHPYGSSYENVESYNSQNATL